MYKVIDVNSWKRRDKYKWFNSFSNPCYGIDANVDVTEIVEFSKKTKTSFFVNFLYILTISLNSIEEMRYRFVNGEVRLYETINPTYVVQRNDLDYVNGGIKMVDDYKEFYKRCRENIDELKVEIKMKDGYNTNNDFDDYYMTCLPWLDYESMSHPIPDDKQSQSVPRICFSKYVLNDNRYTIKLNITVSHALVDGFALSNAFTKVRDNCKIATALLK